MEYRVLPHGGEQVSVIGMGSSVIGAQPEKEIIATVRAAVDSGVNYFDMAGGHAAIFAAYGIEVDHRIVSVAQLPENPFANDEDGLAEEEPPAEAPAESVRLAVVGIDSRLSLGEYAATVRLAYNGQIFEGVARCRDTAIQRDRAPAQATIDAVNAFLGHEAYALLEVKRTHLWSEPVALTALELIADREPRVLIGAALEGVNPPLGIVHSALDALNRSLGRMRRVEEQKA